jgi:small subunit ribosomal protein S1
MTRLFSGSPTLATDAWHAAAAKHPIGSVLGGVVHRISHYGFFIEISDGVDGFVHASDPGLVLLGVPNIGDEVKVRIDSFDPARRRVGFGLVSR